jgi:hypothetical protein
VTDDPEAIPRATVLQRTSVSGGVIATLFMLVILTLIAVVTAYLAAFVIVILHVPVLKLFVGLPLISLVAIAWPFASTANRRDAVVMVLVAAAASAVLWWAVDPTSMDQAFFSSHSDVVGVDTDSVTLSTKTEMTAMPGFGRTVGYAAVLASLTMLVIGMIRPFYDAHQRRKRALDELMSR